MIYNLGLPRFNATLYFKAVVFNPGYKLEPSGAFKTIYKMPRSHPGDSIKLAGVEAYASILKKLPRVGTIVKHFNGIKNNVSP